MKMTTETILVLMITGLLAGVLSGMIGVGGGIIMVPILVLIGLGQHQAQAISLAVMLPPVTMLAVYNYSKQGFLDWKMVAIIALFFVVGGYFGSKIAISIDQKLLRKIFGVIMIVVAGKMIFGK